MALMILFVAFGGAIFLKKSIVDFIALAYACVLGYIAVISHYEILFYPLLIGIALVLVIMCFVHGLKGDVL
jgi:CDP-diglyceride synthetase